MKANQHAQQTRAIVLALLKLPKPRQREMMHEAVHFVHAQCGEQVGSLYDFLVAEPDKVITHALKEQVLNTIARAIRDNDSALLRP